MPISKVPDLPTNIPIVDPKTGFPSVEFVRWWNDSVEATVNALAAGENAAEAATAANAAAAVANTAATTAAAAAATAQTTSTAAAAAAAAAQAQATANAREAAIVNSSISPASVITATPTVISIAAHTRLYGDGTSVAVSAGTVAVTGGTPPYVDYVSYVDPTRAGGAVTYLATTTNPVQGGDTHVVGAVTIPATGSATGGKGPQAPGGVQP